jgi:hypothetical protein
MGYVFTRFDYKSICEFYHTGWARRLVLTGVVSGIKKDFSGMLRVKLNISGQHTFFEKVSKYPDLPLSFVNTRDGFRIDSSVWLPSRITNYSNPCTQEEICFDNKGLM